MANSKQSKNHHWWPVALQSYWADRAGNVSWITPDGEIDKKRYINRKIGSTRHGHRIFRGSVWESNFENEFDIDNEIHKSILALQGIKPFGRTPKEYFALIKMLGKKNRSLRDVSKFYQLDEDLHRNLILLIFSLLIRSPRNRSRYERYGEINGRPPDPNTGKDNIVQNYLIAKKLCQKGPISNQFFVLMHSPSKKFIFGDGSLDWITGGLVANRIDGRALLSLTPHLCVYFCTPISMLSTPNCASLHIAPWMVDWVNDITQIYSKDKLFFHGKPPKITDAFRRRQFLEHAEKIDVLIDMLDDTIGIKKNRSLFRGASPSL